MSSAYITIVGKIKVGDGEEQDVTITGLSDIIPMHLTPVPPRPHPGNPPGIWGGPIDPYPGHPLPEPPIKPPGGGWGIWGGGNEPFPTPPIYWPGFPNWPKPPGGGDGDKPDGGLNLKPVVGWTPDRGWFVVFVPEGDVPAPSK